MNVIEAVEIGSESERKVAVERMWGGGPLREVSPTYRSGWNPHSRYGFTGRYVCEGCMSPVVGVYLVREAKSWLCAGCREAVRR